MWEELGLQQRCMLRKGKCAIEGDPKKSWMGLKQRREPSRRRLGLMLAWWGSTEKKEASHLLGLRGRHQCSEQCPNQNRAPRVASTAVGNRGGGGPNGHIVSVKRTVDERRQRRREIIDKKREKSTGPRTDPCGTPRWTRKEWLL